MDLVRAGNVSVSYTDLHAYTVRVVEPWAVAVRSINWILLLRGCGGDRERHIEGYDRTPDEFARTKAAVRTGHTFRACQSGCACGYGSYMLYTVWCKAHHSMACAMAWLQVGTGAKHVGSGESLYSP